MAAACSPSRTHGGRSTASSRTPCRGRGDSSAPSASARTRRGKGYGAALLDGGLRYLKDAGIAGCVIDWTGLLDFYGKFGFKPYREYLMLGKALET